MIFDRKLEGSIFQVEFFLGQILAIGRAPRIAFCPFIKKSDPRPRIWNFEKIVKNVEMFQEILKSDQKRV